MQLGGLLSVTVAAEKSCLYLSSKRQIGSLQIGCWRPSRLPLYATTLKQLTGAQRSINQALDRGH